MTSIRVIGSQIEDARLSLTQNARGHRLNAYEIELGSDDGLWISRGFFVHMDNGRLVLEALRYKDSHLVVRVYREKPLEILFAVKSKYKSDQFGRALSGAGAIFLDSLPSIVNRAADRETEEMFEDFSTQMPRLREVMSPMPPPYDFKTIEEA